jgi:hypothetical protein
MPHPQLGNAFIAYGRELAQNHDLISRTMGPGLSEHRGFRYMHTQAAWLVPAKYTRVGGWVLVVRVAGAS